MVWGKFGRVALLSLVGLLVLGCNVPPRGAAATWNEKIEELRQAEIETTIGNSQERAEARRELKIIRDDLNRITKIAHSSQPSGMWETTAREAAATAAAELPAAIGPSGTPILVLREVSAAVEPRSGRQSASNGRSPGVRGLQTQLFQTPAVRQRFVLIGMETAEADRALKAAGAGQSFEYIDPLGDNAGTGGPKVYNPNDIFELSCAFSQEQNLMPPTYTCRVDMQLVSARTRQVVWAKVHETSFIYHPHEDINQWISNKEDEAIKEAYKIWYETEGYKKDVLGTNRP